MDQSGISWIFLTFATSPLETSDLWCASLSHHNFLTAAKSSQRAKLAPGLPYRRVGGPAPGGLTPLSGQKCLHFPFLRVVELPGGS
ncbi:hypothetical protein BDM02DRAFT_3117074 [Thelephora ganbajun]|uniref:Uncharacterized protein n=1 Tax=Thelephora ganbajun TaxID=370292 RepID=A0ACB6ZCY2_THEGA|nr:hypothetical protein BDM02DRAFT_3117074 [Thelephora ganbajun]